jgi:hypothetical protein
VKDQAVPPARAEPEAAPSSSSGNGRDPDADEPREFDSEEESPTSEWPKTY